MRLLQLRAQKLGSRHLSGPCLLGLRAGKPMADAGERNEPVSDAHFGKSRKSEVLRHPAR
jgi:hypothetical protein